MNYTPEQLIDAFNTAWREQVRAYESALLERVQDGDHRLVSDFADVAAMRDLLDAIGGEAVRAAIRRHASDPDLR